MLDTQVHSLWGRSWSCALSLDPSCQMSYFTKKFASTSPSVSSVGWILMLFPALRRRYCLLTLLCYLFLFSVSASWCGFILNTHIGSFQSLVCRQQHSEWSQVTERPGIGFVFIVKTHKENTNGSVQSGSGPCGPLRPLAQELLCSVTGAGPL